jgi:hypothetical protein
MLNIQRDPTLATNVDIDSNNIEGLLIISYSLKTMKIVIIIMTITYFTGVFFLIICEGVSDLINDIDVDDFISHGETHRHRLDIFINTFEF